MFRWFLSSFSALFGVAAGLRTSPDFLEGLSCFLPALYAFLALGNLLLVSWLDSGLTPSLIVSRVGQNPKADVLSYLRRAWFTSRAACPMTYVLSIALLGAEVSRAHDV